MSEEKILEPKEIEVELYSEEDYDEMLNEYYGMIKIGYIRFLPSYILSELDPIAYRVGFSEYQEYETRYECPICGAESDNYETSKWCCQEESEDDNDED